jgi:hypothetical protein
VSAAERLFPFSEGRFRLQSSIHPICGKAGHMTPKTIATILILSACANLASAQEGDLKGGGFHRGGYGRFHGRGVGVVGGFVYGDGNGYGGENGYGGVNGNGNNNGNGNDNGNGDWYGLSSGHDDCPLFRKRVMTPDGWREQLVPNC